MKPIKVLITAGPTREAIDPVRYISNHSTGKMGIAIAEAFAAEGCEVSLILGATHLKPSLPMQIISVESAQEMYNACVKIYAETDISIFAAAVADYTPKDVSNEKIKKNNNSWQLELVKTKDIAFEMGLLKSSKQVNVVFALETNNEIEHARQKLEKKNADFVVLNSMRDSGAGFGFDTNKISLLYINGLTTNFALQSKQSLAKIIVKEALQYFHNKQE
ncbi:MAG: phosphopantothenoylcysteine decarboxylase [Chitinophagales bacterium]|nr:phosphopantothenoylcysteine decarboxylase [Chitinophagales bacterium]